MDRVQVLEDVAWEGPVVEGATLFLVSRFFTCHVYLLKEAVGW